VDIREYKGGWLLNDIDNLTETITDEHIAETELDEAGKLELEMGMEGDVDVREKVFGPNKEISHCN
jgi:hypothetical protein